MHYALLLKPHANVRYRQSLQKLALIELKCLLKAWNVTEVSPRVESLAGEPFLLFEAELPQAAWQALSRHSAICLAAQRLDNGALLPMERSIQGFLPDDLPHVLKYKGKTNADFTAMMLHCAQAASAFAQSTEPLQVFDPMCGKATTLFCALCEGHDAIGMDMDQKALQETDTYVARSFRLHRIKHKRSQQSRTLSGGGSARSVLYQAAEDAQAMKDGRMCTLEMLQCDAARCAEVIRPGSVHLIVSDLPYGVQHAPKEGGGMSSLARLVHRVAPGCARVLKPGGALAFSFNINTLRRKEVMQALEDAGLEVMTEAPYDDFSHWVEQAVERDVVVARKKGVVG